MLVYNSTKERFLDDVLTNDIENIILSFFEKKLNRTVSSSEIQSWKNSMSYMDRVLSDDEIPKDSGVAIEFQIPQTSKRVDFILTGKDESNNDQVIIVELKQWSDVEITEKDGVVKTRFRSGLVETSHPSYQAWSYASLLHSFNETVYTDKINLVPCAYLHNYDDSKNIINNNFYSHYTEKAPAFFKSDALKLRSFIKKFVKYGDTSKIMYRIDSGRIRPSKSLADSMASMLKGNQEFIMIDDQKIVFETAVTLAKKSSSNNKNVLIVDGGPGTGKSVVAVNLLVELTKMGLNSQYVTKNAAPRNVYESKLAGTLKKTEISNLFSGSGSFIGVEKGIFDAIIVDEAHRLNEKSGMFSNLGENQIKEIIESSKFSVFFIDEDQKVTWKDIGTKGEILKWSNKNSANITNLSLSSQFRCNGSDGYLAWLDNVLQIKETANVVFDSDDYDLKFFDSPNDLKNEIFEKNKINNKARLVAGYCWDWVSKKNKTLSDIIIPEYDFAMRWNLASDGNLWIISSESVNEIGCIHTCQGLELDYVGVIIGDDLIVRDGKIITNPDKRAKTDASLKGYKKLYKEDPERAINKADLIIKNTYRTLMTRGMKGCYVYCTDKETQEYFLNLLK
ncbi:MAG: DUF2075 domain-containing protein [Candidatus Pacebacteria bacterium]|nr:DUF2075 domain-containing protein [Candidatus Paceibacterota bacterium]